MNFNYKQNVRQSNKLFKQNFFPKFDTRRRNLCGKQIAITTKLFIASTQFVMSFHVDDGVVSYIQHIVLCSCVTCLLYISFDQIDDLGLLFMIITVMIMG